MDKTYYTYISFDKDDNFYIGSATCVGDPEKHNYYGSGKAIKTGEFKPVRKRVINTYDSRGLAGKAEQALIALADPKNNPVCFNKKCAGFGQKMSKQKQLEIGRAYLALRGSRGGSGSNQYAKVGKAKGSTAYLLANLYGISEKSVKLYARLARQELANEQ